MRQGERPRATSRGPSSRSNQAAQGHTSAHVEHVDDGTIAVKDLTPRIVTPICWRCRSTPLRPLDRCVTCWETHLSQLTDYLATVDDVVNFYESDKPFYEFTNFFACPIVVDKKEYPTSEHFFQASKFPERWIADSIRNAFSPREAFTIAQRSRAYQRKDWHEVSLDVMKTALMAKFSIEPMRRLLMLTGKRRLVEHTVNDNFWGDGGDGSGQNHLGRLLEEVRAELSTDRSRQDQRHSTGCDAEEKLPAPQQRQKPNLGQYQRADPRASGYNTAACRSTRPW